MGLSAQRADFEALTKTLAEVHPALANGIPTDLAASFASLEKGLRDGDTVGEFAMTAQKATALLHDGHTRVNTGGSRLLFQGIEPIAGGYVLTVGRNPFLPGDRLVSIGGRKFEDLVALALPLASAENDTRRQTEAAAFACGEIFLAGSGITAGTAKVVALRGKKRVSARLAFANLANGSSYGRPWYFELYPESSLAVLILNTCDPSQSYLATLAAFFRSVRAAGITKVAVDLRQNGGGNSRAVDEFFRYLPIRSYRAYGGAIRISAQSIEQRGNEGSTGLHEYPAGQIVGLDEAQEPSFTGRLFIVVGPQTFSSANWFGVLVQDNHLGTIVGEATGNSPDSYGDILEFRLPNSGLHYTVSYKKWLRPDRSRANDGALRPDVTVARSPTDLAEGRDPVLDWLKEAGR